MEGLVLLIQDLVAYFYTNNGLVTSTQLERLQRVFDVLARIFERFDLQTNASKMVSMACQTCHTPGQISSKAYKQQMIGMGPIFLVAAAAEGGVPKVRSGSKGGVTNDAPSEPACSDLGGPGGVIPSTSDRKSVAMKGS